jgi:hypothetical protein
VTDGISSASLYLLNGNPAPGPKFDYKRMRSHTRNHPIKH